MLSLNINWFFYMLNVCKYLYIMTTFNIVNNRSVMDFHIFYVYYDGETYYHDLHGLSYQGSNQKQKCVRVKRGIGLMNLQRRILKVMGLD